MNSISFCKINRQFVNEMLQLECKSNEKYIFLNYNDVGFILLL